MEPLPIPKLTQKQCLHIANMINSDINWRIEHLPKDLQWNGVDIVESTAEQKELNYIVQIDYRDSDELRGYHRIRYYEYMEEVDISDMTRYLIYDFLRIL